VTISVTYDFRDAVILITGAGSGIGAALAWHCAREGATVVAVDRVHERLLSKIEDAARERIDVRVVNVANESDVAAMIDDVKRRYPRLDAAVLGAAIQYRTDLDEIAPERWREIIDINLNGVFYCLRGIIPMMKAQEFGAIVVFTSGLAHSGWAGASAYSASKAALIGMIKSVAHELKDFNIRANVLSPGVRATPIFMDVSTEEERAFYEKTIGINEPEGVIPTLLYLISDASENLTGAVIEHRISPGREQSTRS
jgi:NAD(P)-dependent dehydrogenase (short-subunit alcohol dehydrogenase family)